MTKSPIDTNLEKMLGGRSEMNKLLMQESIGGNAGDYYGKNCFAANFHFDRETGEIKRFTNNPINDDENGIFYGTFRLLATRKDPPTIVDYKIDDGSSRLAKAVMGLTIEKYNHALKS